MITEGYPHVIEYSLDRGKGVREHRYTEHVDDMGFVLEHKESRREKWLAHYAGACAEDYFRRVRAPRGTWLVTVYRAPRRHLVTIRLSWPKKENTIEDRSCPRSSIQSPP